LNAQYTSFRFTIHLIEAGIEASIGTVGDALDNALMESAIGLCKTELIKPRGPWKHLTGLELATAEWVDWCNTTRLHGEIGHVPPDEYEAGYFQDRTESQVTVTTQSLYRNRGASVFVKSRRWGHRVAGGGFGK
jgi:putative transposase